MTTATLYPEEAPGQNINLGRLVPRAAATLTLYPEEAPGQNINLGRLVPRAAATPKFSVLFGPKEKVRS